MNRPAQNSLRLLATSLLIASALGTQQVAASLDRDSAIASSRGAVGGNMADGRFIDAEGSELRLSALRGKPLVVSMVYTSCPDTCAVTTRQLAHVVDIAREALGEDAFTVISVGFDTAADTPIRMRSYARANGVHGDPRWRFLSADTATVAALTDSLGFSFAPSPRGFDHLAQVTVVDAEGVVYRQVYGDPFDPPALVEPLKELTFGRRADAVSIAGWLDGLKLLCTVYDPASGRYTFDYSVFVTAGIGTLALGGMGVFLFRSWRETRRGRPTT